MLWSTSGSEAASSLRCLSEDSPKACGQPCLRVTSTKGGWQSTHPPKSDPVCVAVGGGILTDFFLGFLRHQFFWHSSVSLALRTRKPHAGTQQAFFGCSSVANCGVSGPQSCEITGKFFRSLSELPRILESTWKTCFTPSIPSWSKIRLYLQFSNLKPFCKTAVLDGTILDLEHYQRIQFPRHLQCWAALVSNSVCLRSPLAFLLTERHLEA